MTEDKLDKNDASKDADISLDKDMPTSSENKDSASKSLGKSKKSPETRTSKAKPGTGIKGDNRLRALIETLGDSIIPKGLRKNILNYLERASIEDVPYYSFGIATIVLAILAIILDVLLMGTNIFANANIIIMIIASVILIPPIFLLLSLVATFIFKLYLEARIYYKVRRMEEAFPEFLSELGLNLKSGQSLEEALGNSIEKEFGYLGSEIERVCKKVRLGVEIEVAIKEFTDSFDSEIIEETFDLIVTSWKKGAGTSQLVDRVYENLEVIRYLKRKVIASVTGYRIFLSIVTIIIAPAMFALAYYLIDLIRAITNQMAGISSSTVFPFAINAVRINDQHFILFSTLALVLVSICTAMIISIIKTGNIKEGYKQVLLFAAGSVISYRLFLLVFRIFFGMFNV
jgi:Flp pilus assembly protein TadB